MTSSESEVSEQVDRGDSAAVLLWAVADEECIRVEIDAGRSPPYPDDRLPRQRQRARSQSGFRERSTLITSPWTATSIGRRKRPRDEIDRLIAKAVAGERWIMDGTGLSSFHLRLPRADAVIWLRPSRYACLYGIISKAFRYFGRNRPELPAGCPERLSLSALSYIWNFERDAVPLIETALQDYGLANSNVVIRSREAARRS